MSQNKRNFTRAIYVFDAVVHRVPNDKWDSQSPCDGWTAKDLLRHQCGVLQAMAATLQSGETVPPEPIESADNPVAAWTQTRDSVLAELDEPGILDREGKFWFGPMSVDQWIQVVQWDPMTHAWEIASAVGIAAHIPDDLASVSHEVLSGMRETLHKWGLISDEVAIAQDASASDKFLALIGRDPR